MENLQQNVKSKADSPLGFTVNNTDQSASIVYERLGEQCIILVPYNRSHIPAMAQFKVELLRDEKSPVDITQQPGIPYLISADALGGIGIRITNQDNGVIKTYDRFRIPMYGIEAMMEE